MQLKARKASRVRRFGACARVSLLALALNSALGVEHALVAAAIPHRYDGRIQFDIRSVPFSRYGSYLAFSQVRGGGGLPDGLYLRILHGIAGRKELFRVELFDGRVPVAFKQTATPTELRQDAN